MSETTIQELKRILDSSNMYDPNYAAIERAADRIEELEAIVARLPRTADGHAVVPGLNVWVVWLDAPAEWRRVGEIDIDRDAHLTDHRQLVPLDRSYVTKSAAREAMESNDE